MEIIADLHLHSKYSRAVSSKMVIPQISYWASLKGIDLVGIPDWTHPLWLKEIQSELLEVTNGIFVDRKNPQGPKFLLATEISSIFSQGGKGRRVHSLVLAPGFSAVEKINEKLHSAGANLISDGRPIVGLSPRQLLEIVLSVDKNCLLIPAHVWTPWFSMYGSKSGFNSISDCFGQEADKICAIETGLSSDPEMNWKIRELDNRSIVSFSDAHSLENLGREATVFETPLTKEFDYEEIRKAIAKEGGKIKYTIEFYPEEGKYHFTGHRNCQVVLSPAQTAKNGIVCPVCGKGLTVGVVHRVEELSDKSYQVKSESSVDQNNVSWVGLADKPRFVKLVPLLEIIAEARGVGKQSKGANSLYQHLLKNLGGEIEILLRRKIGDIQTVAGEKIAEGVTKVRKGDIDIQPGYDGEYGKVAVWSDQKNEQGQKIKKKNEQASLF